MTALAYDEAGEGDPHLLFMHGWCGDRTFFAPQFDYFSAMHRVVSVDLPGHGASAVPPPSTPLRRSPARSQPWPGISASDPRLPWATAWAPWWHSPWPDRRPSSFAPS